MEEVGVVKEIQGDDCLVEVSARPVCLGCTERSSCGVVQDKKALFGARNALRAQVGDEVRIELNPRVALLSAVAVCVLPIGGLVAGYIAGSRLFHPAWMTALSTLAGLGAGLAVVVLLDRLLKRSGTSKPVVVEIVRGGEKE